MPPSLLAPLAQTCTRIGNAAADPDGYVAIRRLLDAFQAQLLVRPLLVEGMIAQLPGTGPDSSAARWAVLIDSDTYKVDPAGLDAEGSLHPLPERLRNTIAHELVHSLAFRPTEFGARFLGDSRSAEGQAAFVEEVERETERLSPLLLWPETAIAKLLGRRAGPLQLADFVYALGRFAISRFVLINRLGMLRVAGGGNLLMHKALRNLAVLRGEWTPSGPVLRKWPMFVNFDRNLAPEVIHRLASQDRLPASSLFDHAADHIRGGDVDSTVSVVSCGTPSAPRLDTMKIESSAERVARKAGAQFLVVVRDAAAIADGVESPVPARTKGVASEG
jgi:hypothetical protein